MCTWKVICLSWLVMAGPSAVSRGLAAGSPNGWVNSLKPRGRPGPELTLASGGSTDYVLVLPAQPTTQEEKAASDLAQWLKDMTRADFPIVREGADYKGTKKAISVGQTALLEQAGLRAAEADLGNEGYAIAVQGEILYLLGGRTRGPINAVYALLEEDLGCRWYDRTSSTIPHVPELKFRPVPRRFVPVLEIRDPFYWDAFEGTWSLRNRTNAPSAPVPEEWGGNVDYALFVHTFNTLVPPEQHFRQHPEYFAEINGKRQTSQLCLTNPEVLKIATDRVREVLKDRPNSEIISVSPNDGTGYCECRNCKEIDEAEGTKAGTLLRFVNAVADAIKSDFPKVKVSTLAYLDTFMPPKTIRPRDNVAIQLCTDRHAWARPFLVVTETEKFQKAMKAWAAIGATMHIWDYTVNFSHYVAPMPNMPVVTPDIRFFFRHNARGVMLQGAYQSPGAENVSLRCWVWAKQLWDPSRNTRPLMRDFIYGYYGQAAEPVQEYNDLLWEMWEKYHRKPKTSLAVNPLLCDIRYPPDSPLFSTDFLRKASELFTKAESLATDPETLRRVKLAKLPVLYVKLCQGVGYLADDGQFKPGARLAALTQGRQPDDSGYKEELAELEQIVKQEGITHFAEGAPDATRKIQLWKEMLATSLPKVAFREIGNVWKFKPDPDNVGVAEKWYAAGTDDSDWKQVRSDRGNGWESQGFQGYTGYGWYRQRVTAPSDLEGKFHHLLFGAVDEDAEIYINGKKAFDHTCGSTGLVPSEIWITPFAFDPRTWVQPGSENLIAVRIYNTLGMGGIWKPAYFVSSDTQAPASMLMTIIQAQKPQPR